MLAMQGREGCSGEESFGSCCGEGDYIPGEADEALTLEQKEHSKFKRTGEDLFVEHTLSISEALSGFQIILTHLDGRQLLIKSQPSKVVSIYENPSMPFYMHNDFLSCYLWFLQSSVGSSSPRNQYKAINDD